ncbi:MAG: DUF3078 domain-containing protein, partial [Candidatus Kryptoniota bacterium]
MKKCLLMILCLAANCITADSGLMAQVAKPDSLRSDTVNVWVPTMVTALNLSQLAFNNWTQGGSNSLSWTATANVGYDYKGEEWGLNNHLRAGYGTTKLGSQRSTTTVNDFFLENVLSYRTDWAVKPFFSNEIITTLSAGYDNNDSLIANFFDPGYVTQSAGFSYDKLGAFTTRLGLATQEIFANKHRQYTEDSTAFQLKTGLESVSHAKLQIADNMLLTTGLRLCTTFNHLGIWDVRWDNTVASQVN